MTIFSKAYNSLFPALCLSCCLGLCSIAGEKPIPLPPADHERKPAGELTKMKPVSTEVSEIIITPAFETAGVIITTGAKKVDLEIRKLPDGAFTRAHPFVRFDQAHMAASIFNLLPGTEYAIRIQGKHVKSFVTMEEGKPVSPAKLIRLTPADSIKDVVRKVTPGTVLLLASGTYKTGGIALVQCKGSADAPIVIRGDVSGSEMKKHISKRNLPCIDASAAAYGFFIDRSKHVIIENIRIQGAGSHGVRLSGSEWCVVRNCQIYDNGHDNVLISKGGKDQHHIRIENNHIADRQHGPFKFSHQSPADVTYYGIKRDNSPGWATVIRGNLIEGVVDGIASGGDEMHAASAKTSLPDIRSRWPNFELDVYDNVIIDCRDDAIETDGISINCRFFRNYLGGVQNGVSIAPSMPGPFFFVRNLMENFNESSVKLNTKAGRGTIRNAYFYHNSIVRRKKTEAGKGALLNLWDGTPSQNIVFMNNLFSGVERCVTIQSKRTHKPRMDYNLWYTPEPVSFYWWKGSLWKKSFAEGWVKELGCDRHGLWAAPKIDRQMRLQKDSPAIDRGAVIPGVNDGFAGKAPDIGAIEFTGENQKQSP